MVTKKGEIEIEDDRSKRKVGSNSTRPTPRILLSRLLLPSSFSIRVYVATTTKVVVVLVMLVTSLPRFKCDASVSN
jgi:hypothetical protein